MKKVVRAKATNRPPLMPLLLEDAIDMTSSSVSSAPEVEVVRKVSKAQVKWDDITETILLMEINSDNRSMNVSRPGELGRVGAFWSEVATAVNSHAPFSVVTASEKSCKDHYGKMVAKQKVGIPESTTRETYRFTGWWTRGGQNPTGSNGQWTLNFFLSLTMDNGL